MLEKEVGHPASPMDSRDNSPLGWHVIFGLCRIMTRTWADKAISEWCALARAMNHPGVKKFANTLCRYRYGILNHCDYPIHTRKLEGVNNKIKVIKRRAYGFHDLRYFSLKIIQAFVN